MKIPGAKMISKKPFAIRCPACSVTFEITAYSGTGEQKIAQMEQDYEQHFRVTHDSTNA
jgi:hypothetical protein